MPNIENGLEWGDNGDKDTKEKSCIPEKDRGTYSFMRELKQVMEPVSASVY